MIDYDNILEERSLLLLTILIIIVYVIYKALAKHKHGKFCNCDYFSVCYCGSLHRACLFEGYFFVKEDFIRKSAKTTLLMKYIHVSSLHQMYDSMYIPPPATYANTIYNTK